MPPDSWLLDVFLMGHSNWLCCCGVVIIDSSICCIFSFSCSIFFFGVFNSLLDYVSHCVGC